MKNVCEREAVQFSTIQDNYIKQFGFQSKYFNDTIACCGSPGQPVEGWKQENLEESCRDAPNSFTRSCGPGPCSLLLFLLLLPPFPFPLFHRALHRCRRGVWETTASPEDGIVIRGRRSWLMSRTISPFLPSLGDPAICRKIKSRKTYVITAASSADSFHDLFLHYRNFRK